jgi:L-galactose dehydrogenase/L-glyceraldehyde 3-phosphate reductase
MREPVGGPGMRYTALGRSGVTISRVGFGCGDRAGLMVGTDHAVQDRLVGRALDAGISYFDTAAKYGAGQSERSLGRALRGYRRDVVVGTKLELPPSAGAPFARTVREHLQASLDRLGSDHVHLYQLHDRIGAEGWAPPGAKRLTVSEVLGPGGVGDALVALKQQGRISAVGLTTFGGDPLAVAEVVGSGLFDSLNCSFHMLNPTALVRPGPGWTALDYGEVAVQAHEQGMAVLGIRALGGGQLLGAGTDPVHPEIVWAERVRRTLEAALDGPARARTAMSWVLRWPQVSCLIAGISAAAHVDEAVAAAADTRSWIGSAAREWCETLYRAAVPEPQHEEMSP